jgi:hypothetical protein
MSLDDTTALDTAGAQQVDEDDPYADADSDGSDELSPKRRLIIEEILPSVIPSTYPDSRFNLMTGGAPMDLDGMWAGNPTYTTCEILPGLHRPLPGRGRLGRHLQGTDGGSESGRVG